MRFTAFLKPRTQPFKGVLARTSTFSTCGGTANNSLARAVNAFAISPVKWALRPSSDPHDVVGAIELSRAAYRKMVQNLVWATAYNLIAIPVAAGLFVRWRIDLPMSVGAIAMSTSTMIVALNAQLLRRLRIVRHKTIPN